MGNQADQTVEVWRDGAPVEVTNPLPVEFAGSAAGIGLALDASEDHVGQVGGEIIEAAVEFTRPNNATPYTAKDVVGPVVTANLLFDNIARVDGGSGFIVKARLITDQSANVARHRLHLYNVAPTAIADNAPFTLLWDNRAKRIGYIDFPAGQTEGSGSDSANASNPDVRLAFKCASGSRDLYGILETIDVYTPANNQHFFVQLTADVN